MNSMTTGGMFIIQRLPVVATELFVDRTRSKSVIRKQGKRWKQGGKFAESTERKTERMKVRKT